MPGGAPGMGGQGNTAGAETITNSDSFSETTFTDPGGGLSAGDESISLPDTGGEPLLMVLGGLTLAASAFAVRRKLA